MKSKSVMFSEVSNLVVPPADTEDSSLSGLDSSTSNGSSPVQNAPTIVEVHVVPELDDERTSWTSTICERKLTADTPAITVTAPPPHSLEQQQQSTATTPEQFFEHHLMVEVARNFVRDLRTMSYLKLSSNVDEGEDEDKTASTELSASEADVQGLIRGGRHTTAGRRSQPNSSTREAGDRLGAARAGDLRGGSWTAGGGAGACGGGEAGDSQESSLTQSGQMHPMMGCDIDINSDSDSDLSTIPPSNRDRRSASMSASVRLTNSSESRNDNAGRTVINLPGPSNIDSKQQQRLGGQQQQVDRYDSGASYQQQGKPSVKQPHLSTVPTPTGYLRMPDEATPLLKTKHTGGNRSQRVGSTASLLSSPHDDTSCQSGSPQSDLAYSDARLKHWANMFKVVLLTATVLFAVVVMSFIEETKESWLSVSLNNEEPFYVSLRHQLSPSYPILRLKAAGPFLPESLANLSSVDTVFALVRRFHDGSHQLLDGHDPLVVATAPPIVAPHMAPSGVEHMFAFELNELLDTTDEFELLVQARRLQGHVSVSLQVTPFTEFTQIELLMAAFVLVGLYVLIIFELCHRTLAAMLGATWAIACLALIGDRPTLEKVVSWLDVETLCLLFGMMVLVAILCETGFFDYTAVVAFRVARGKVWPLITTLCLLTAVMSAFLDNVTTILLMTPVTIKLCEVMNLDPKHVLISLVMFSNIGGAATPVGDPPNVIIISNPKVQANGVNFTNFTLHLLPGVLMSGIGAYIYLRLYYRDDSSLRHQQPQEVVEIQHEIDIWQKACRSLSEYSRDESHVRAILKKKVKNLKNLYRKKLVESSSPSNADFKHNLRQLTDKYKIRNWALLIKSGVVLSFVISLFFLQSIPNLNLSLGWIAILGALALLVLADMEELEGVFGRVEWSTLLFFAALFVVMEALTELKLLQFIGDQTEDWIRAVDPEHRLVVGIVLVTWVSSFASCFIDNIPFTTVMVKIVAKLGESDAVDLPIRPLVYALAFGACLGGNGTLIGASANVVCAGVAEHHGYRFTFVEFFKIGFPVMLVTTSISTCWLLFTHVVLEWN